MADACCHNWRREISGCGARQKFNFLPHSSEDRMGLQQKESLAMEKMETRFKRNCVLQIRERSASGNFMNKMTSCHGHESGGKGGPGHEPHVFRQGHTKSNSQRDCLNEENAYFGLICPSEVRNVIVEFLSQMVRTLSLPL